MLNKISQNAAKQDLSGINMEFDKNVQDYNKIFFNEIFSVWFRTLNHILFNKKYYFQQMIFLNLIMDWII